VTVALGGEFQDLRLCYDVSMVKAFLFNNGGVITAGGGGNELSERLAENLHIDPDAAFGLLMPVWDLYAQGKISEPDLWRVIEKQYGQPIHTQQRNIWNKWEDMQPLPEMVQLVQQLKNDGYTVGLLSNVIPNTEHEIRANGGYDMFDFTVLSCKVGYSKPDPKMYTIAMDHLPELKPDEVVFLDDQERCLEPARSMGMQIVLVDSPAQAIAETKQLIATQPTLRR